MPFLKDMARRKVLDAIVFLMEKLDIQANGDLNYVLYKFAKRNIDTRYNNLKNYCGELEETAGQIRYDILWPYEQKLKEEYGDV